MGNTKQWRVYANSAQGTYYVGDFISESNQDAVLQGKSVFQGELEELHHHSLMRLATWVYTASEVVERP